MSLIISLFIAITIYIVQQRLYREMWDKNLSVDLKFKEPYVRVGEKNVLIETIENAKFLPMPILHVKFSTSRTFKFSDCENASVTDLYHRNDVFSVMGAQKVTRNLEFQVSKRGFYNISSINIIAKDFFLTRTFADTVSSDARLYVFPEQIKGIKLETLFNTVVGQIEMKKSLVEDPYTFRGIREYDTLDSMGKINWKATARCGNLMVNMYNHTTEQTIKILLNLETNSMIKTELLQEITIQMASTASIFFLSRKVPTGIISNGADIITGNCEQVMKGASCNHAITIDKYLSRIQKNSGIEQFFSIVQNELEAKDINTTYVIISPYYKDDLLVKLDYMRSIGMTIFMLIPYFSVQEFSPCRDYMYGWEVSMDES